MRDEMKGGNFDSAAAPIFVMGCHRTGTTLVRRILNSHSRIEIYHESQYYPIFRHEIYYYGDLGKRANLIRFINDFREVIRVQCLDPSDRVPETEEFLEALVAPTYEGVLATSLLLYAQHHGKMRGGDKTPQHYAYLPEISDSFPDSPIIFLMRDPRDTVLSIRERFNTSIEGATRHWNEAVYAYQQKTRPVLLLRYEDLVQRPTEIIKSMCEFLGEPYEASMLRFFDKTPEQIIEQKGGKLLGPMDTSSVGRFESMSEAEIEQVERECAAGMQLMGYSFTILQEEEAVKARIILPSKRKFIVFVFDRLRYYNWNLTRWRHGWMRWKCMLKVRIRYLLMLGPFRKNW